MLLSQAGYVNIAELISACSIQVTSLPHDLPNDLPPSLMTSLMTSLPPS